MNELKAPRIVLLHSILFGILMVRPLAQCHFKQTLVCQVLTLEGLQWWMSLIWCVSIYSGSLNSVCGWNNWPIAEPTACEEPIISSVWAFPPEVASSSMFFIQLFNTILNYTIHYLRAMNVSWSSSLGQTERGCVLLQSPTSKGFSITSHV